MASQISGGKGPAAYGLVERAKSQYFYAYTCAVTVTMFCLAINNWSVYTPEQGID